MLPSSTLNGARILVTRPEHQATRLCKLIEQFHGKAVRFPVLEILPLEETIKDNSSFVWNGNFDWVFFVSSNAVNFAQLTKSGKIEQLRDARFVAIGQATAKAMHNAGMKIDLVPEQGYNSEALLAMPEMQQVDNQHCLIVRGVGGRELLAETLHQRGAKVTYLEVYKRVLPNCDGSYLIEMIDKKRLDVVTVTSCEALQNLVFLSGKEAGKRLLLIPLVVISERIEHLARSIGFKQITVASKPSDAEIINTISIIINGE